MSITPGAVDFPATYATEGVPLDTTGFSLYTTTTQGEIVAAGSNTAGVVIHGVFANGTTDTFAIAHSNSATDWRHLFTNGENKGIPLPFTVPAGDAVWLYNGAGSGQRFVIYEVL
jgi:hypothetical protein